MSKKYTVAIQGELGCYHHEAINALSERYDILRGKIDVTPRTNSYAVMEALVNEEVNLAILAIENPSYGATNQTYKLLMDNSSVGIIGEIYLPINHQLIVSGADVSVEDVEVVESQPEALGQCMKFIDSIGANTESSSDTVGSAIKVIKSGAKNRAAIASAAAADYYGGHIAASSIQDNPDNYTRFVLLSRVRGLSLPGLQQKTSIWLTLKERPGALAEVLTIFANKGLNLVRIESRSSTNNIWKYCFFIDIEHQVASSTLEQALEEVADMSAEYRNLGSYPADPSR